MSSLICLKIVLCISHMLTAIHCTDRSGDWLLFIIQFPCYNKCDVCNHYHGDRNAVPLHKWEEGSFHKMWLYGDDWWYYEDSWNKFSCMSLLSLCRDVCGRGLICDGATSRYICLHMEQVDLPSFLRVFLCLYYYKTHICIFCTLQCQLLLSHSASLLLHG